MSSRIDQSHTIHNKLVAATIKQHGAELSSLKNAAGSELLWPRPDPSGPVIRRCYFRSWGVSTMTNFGIGARPIR
jgi:hypothetical protein